MAQRGALEMLTPHLYRVRAEAKDAGIDCLITSWTIELGRTPGMRFPGVAPLHVFNVACQGSSPLLDTCVEGATALLRGLEGDTGPATYVAIWDAAAWSNVVVFPLKRGALPAVVEQMRSLGMRRTEHGIVGVVTRRVFTLRDAVAVQNLAPNQVRAVADAAALYRWQNGTALPFRLQLDATDGEGWMRRTTFRVQEPHAGQDLQCLAMVQA